MTTPSLRLKDMHRHSALRTSVLVVTTKDVTLHHTVVIIDIRGTGVITRSCRDCRFRTIQRHQHITIDLSLHLIKLRHSRYIV